MHLGFITTPRGYQWSGSEELWFSAALLALRMGHQVSALVNPEMKDAHALKHLTQQGGRVIVKAELPLRRLEQVRAKFFSRHYHESLSKVDVLVISLGSLLDPIFTSGLIQFLKSTNIPYFILCQFNAENLLFTTSTRPLIHCLFKTAMGLVFVSQHNLKLAQRQLADSLKKSTVIYNPIRITPDHPLVWPDISIVQMGCVARIETLWKGQDVLLQVLSEKQWMHRQWHLNFYGEGPDLCYLHDLICYYSLEKKVSFHGYVREVESIWSDNHIMVLASRGEGNSLAILEAMMCGRPTVTTDVGGNREILEDGITGFIADVATPHSFSNALEYAWQKKDCWQEMGNQAHYKAKQLADLKPAQQLLDFICDPIERNNNESFSYYS